MIFWNKHAIHLSSSKLFDDTNFYSAFLRDIAKAEKEVLIESPYITSSRMELFLPVFERLLNKKVKICLVTRDPIEHDEIIRYQATNEILYCKEMGIDIKLLLGNHHRKLAIIDRSVLWEGSLNILSQNSSKEVMRRIKSKDIAMQMYKFLKLDRIT